MKPRTAQRLLRQLKAVEARAQSRLPPLAHERSAVTAVVRHAEQLHRVAARSEEPGVFHDLLAQALQMEQNGFGVDERQTTPSILEAQALGLPAHGLVRRPSLLAPGARAPCPSLAPPPLLPAVCCAVLASLPG